jgi:hypothetical protein
MFIEAAFREYAVFVTSAEGSETGNQPDKLEKIDLFWRLSNRA